MPSPQGAPGQLLKTKMYMTQVMTQGRRFSGELQSPGCMEIQFSSPSLEPSGQRYY